MCTAELSNSRGIGCFRRKTARQAFVRHVSDRVMADRITSTKLMDSSGLVEFVVKRVDEVVVTDRICQTGWCQTGRCWTRW